MTNRLRGLVAVLLVAVAAAGLHGTELPDSLRFDHLGVEDGLSSSSVSRIIQDREGFIWFATQSGLNRYDGYSVNRYEHDSFDRNSLSHNLIQTMYYDEDGIFWIGTYGGLNRFDPDTRSFEVFTNEPGNSESLSNNVVVAVARDPAGALWVGTLNGLNRYVADRGSFVRYTPGDPEDGALPDKVIRSLTVDARGTLWIGSYGGLSRYNSQRDSFETLGTDDGFGEALPSPYVMSIVQDPASEEHLWVGTWDGGVSRVNTRTGEVENSPLPQSKVYTMLFDRNGRLWVGTWGNGLYIMDPETGEYRHFTADSTGLADGLSHDVVYSFMEDESGIVWVGTNGGGVDKFVPWENRFENFVHEPDDSNTITAGKVDSIHIDADGTAWFGVYNGGLCRYEPDREDLECYRHDPSDPTSLSNEVVNVVFRDSRGRLLVGTNNGLNRYVPEAESFERVYSYADAFSLPEDVTFEIAENEERELWFGTHTAGVAVLDPETGTYRGYTHDPDDPTSLSDDMVRTVLHDSRGNTWVGTNQGLNRYDPDSDSFIRYLHDPDDSSSLSSNNITHLYEDSADRLWITTTGGGVNRYHYEADSFSFMSNRDGLASNHVFSVLEDGRGSLWFSTSRGLSVYDPERDSFRTLNTANGLLTNDMADGSARGPGGKLYFGGERGVTVIDPMKDAYSTYTPPVVLTDVEVLGEQRELTTRPDGTYAALVLGPSDSFFSVEFAALDYSSPQQNSYLYMLEGFDEEWVNAGSRHFASYTNLDPGEYELRIRGAGSRANWNEAGASLPIQVLPPWWQTNAARVGYLVLFIAVLFLFARRLQRRGMLAEARLAEQERINAELDRKVQERTAEIENSRRLAEQASREKSRFLANMSHEIRTPLTGMIGMLSLLEHTSLEDRQREYLRYSRVSAENLNTLVNDLLDFERIEAGELRFSAEPFSLRETARYIERLFEEAVARKGLTLDVEIELDGVPETVCGDRSRVVQILTNLVSNAVKYTPEGGVTVRIYPAARGGTAYTFEVSDTGRGIVPQQRETIFERFIQLDNGYTKGARGVGLGLSIVKQVVEAMGGSIRVDSTPEEGSSFFVTVPFGEADSARQAEAVADPVEARAVAADAGRTRAAHVAPSDGTGTEAAPAGDGRPEETHVLVCEDEAINRLYLTRYLEDLDLTVDVAADGHEAVEKATSGRYSLVFMDLSMPGVSGLEATRQIRAQEEDGTSRIPIVALTAHTYAEDIERCREAGMDDFVSKPIKERELRSTISKWTQHPPPA